MARKKSFVIANLPAVQRDLYLSRCIRRVEDKPAHVETLKVQWEDMTVSFATNEAISEVSVEVASDISLPVFTKRLESLLDCGAKSDSLEWTLKWSDKISRYGEIEQVRRLLCDKVASMDGENGETVGVLKIKRRSVKSGHAKIRLVPGDDSLQVVCRHTNAQGLKAVWKSVLWRLRPQYSSSTSNKEEKNGGQSSGSGNGYRVTFEPCILVQEGTSDYYYHEAVSFLSRNGYEVETGKDISMVLPLDLSKSLDSNYAWFFCEVVMDKTIPANMPSDISLQKNDNGKVYVSVRNTYASDFKKKAQAISDWLGLGWNLEESAS